jgi:type I restriction enzyme S subunit
MTFEKVDLGTVCKFFNNSRKPVTRSNRVAGEYRYFGAAGIQDYVSEYLFDGDFILVGEDGTVITEDDRPVVQQVSGKFWVNNHAHVIQPNEMEDYDYLYFAISSTKVRDLVTGAVQPKLSMTNLKQLQIHWAEESVARLAIGSVLRNLDSKIAANNALSKTLEDIAQTIFKSWFIDFDPVKAKMAGEKPAGMDEVTAALFPDSMEESEMGLIPKGWRIGSLEEIVDLQGGYAFKSSSWTDCGVPVIKIGSVKPGYVDLTQVSYVDTSLAEGISDDYRIPAGSLVVGLTGYVGQVGLVRTHEPVPLVNQRVAKFKPRSGDWKIPFIYCFTRDPKFKVIVEELSTGTAQQNVSNSQILSIPLVIPNNEIQKSFEDSLTPLFNQIINLADENESLKSLRDALLPRLISGELQIPEEMLAS